MNSDKALGKILKSWAAEYKPPVNGRLQLLSQASVQKKNRNLSFLIPRSQFNDYPVHTNNEWSQSLFCFLFAQSIHASVQARL